MKYFLTILFYFTFNILFSQNIDNQLVINLHQFRNQNLDKGFNLLSQTTYPVSFGLPALTLGVAFLKKDKILLNKALFWSSSVLGSAVVTIGLKNAINRNRPYQDLNFVEPFYTSNTSSFPSGHSSLAFTTATNLSISYPKWYVIVPSYLWAGSISYSRLHNGHHYFSDVFAGALIGTGSAFLFKFLNDKLNSRVVKK